MNSNISLDDFGPELGGVARANAVRVGEILARGVPIRWDEAVALLEEILEIVLSQGGTNAIVPIFDDVLIDGDGAVDVHNSRRGERGPVAAGRALHALLATADVPVPLRLFVTQANAPETHQSLQAFAEGLAYFGRPGREEMIRAIYERYRSSSPSTTLTANKPVVPPPLPNINRPEEPPELRKRTAQAWLMPAAVGLCVVSLGAVIWLGGLGGDSSSGDSLVAKAKEAIATVAPTLKGALASETSAKPTTAEATPTKPASNARSRQPATSSNRVERATSGSSSGRSFDPFVRPFELAPTSTPEPAGASASAAIPLTREFVVAPHEDPSATIYTPADADVQPPVMLYPSLPPPVFFAREGEAVAYNRMELVIAPDGSVERVRLVNGPTRMPDMMLLSGAKAWKFSPAVKDGVPVRYRTTISWTGFP